MLLLRSRADWPAPGCRGLSTPLWARGAGVLAAMFPLDRPRVCKDTSPTSRPIYWVLWWLQASSETSLD